jgi:SAM-dependent methyltransferase
MYRLGKGSDLWEVAESLPELTNRGDVLKPLGYAFAISQITNSQAHRILEIGHGASPPVLQRFSADKECWGIDGEDPDKTVSKKALQSLRRNNPGVKFVNGFIGNSEGLLPSDYFDLSYSVSVIEHIKETDIESFAKDLYRITRPGGFSVHSYDVWWGRDTRYMLNAFNSAGFKWLEPQPKIFHYGESWLHTLDVEDLTKRLGKVAFENISVVLEKFSWGIPRNERSAHNWVTILLAVQKI